MVDVLLILEGTYPFVRGGVSSWVHAILTGMPDLSFGIIYLSDRYQPEREARYDVPANVKYLTEIPVYDLVSVPPDRGADSERSWRAFFQLSEEIHRARIRDFESLYKYLGPGGQRGLTLAELGCSPMSWKALTELYRDQAEESSFVDFFWTWKAAFASLLQLLLVKQEPARLFHTVCTGWAGLVGAVLRRHQKRPLMLTEHGIYTNERRIEIVQAQWLSGPGSSRLSLHRELGYLKTFWVNLFTALGQVCYDQSDQITTLYGGNKELHVEYGADPDKIVIIPNGVRLERFGGSRRRAENEPLRVGFIGRVVPIKDVKTLLVACREVLDKVPNVRFDILGPYEEDPEYFGECRELVGLLGLQTSLTFHGRVDVTEWYPKLDVMVLTSISEGQPLVILEGYCSGLPCVATDVGSCRELIEGRTAEDRALGPAGRVTGVGNPEETASALIEILSDQALRDRMSDSARQRVHKFYSHKQMIRTYRDHYDRLLAQPDLSFEESL